MIAAMAQGFRRFLQDPLAAMEEFRDAVPAAPVAAMALMLLVLIHGIIDYPYGAFAWPESVEPGGKRFAGPIVGTLVALSRIFATAAVLWFGSKVLMKHQISGALAMWMTVPYAMAEIGLDLIEVATVILFLLTEISIYGQMFMIGFIGKILVMILAVRATFPDRDWLSCLPLGAAGIVGGMMALPLLILPLTGSYLLLRRFK